MLELGQRVETRRSAGTGFQKKSGGQCPPQWGLGQRPVSDTEGQSATPSIGGRDVTKLGVTDHFADNIASGFTGVQKNSWFRSDGPQKRESQE